MTSVKAYSFYDQNTFNNVIAFKELKSTKMLDSLPADFLDMSH